MANWGRRKGTAGDKPDFKFLNPANIAGSTSNDGRPAAAQHVGWVKRVDTGSGAVTDVSDLVGGDGYTEATVEVVGAGVEATAEAVIDTGVITEINITNGGRGYVQETTTIVITGQSDFAGTQATAVPVVTNRIKEETIVAFGSMEGALGGGPDWVFVGTTTVPNQVVQLTFAYAYDVTIDWGDGTIEDVSSLVNDQWASDVPMHTYVEVGSYDIVVSGAATSWYYDWNNPLSWVSAMSSFGDNIGWLDLQNMFRATSVITEVPTSLPSSVTNLNGIFRDATSFNQDISSWNVSNVTEMRDMFRGTDVFNQDISSWNVANVTDMRDMFRGTGAFNQPIGSWNVANVTSMSAMFRDATSFNQPIGSWNVANVTNMSSLFEGAPFNQPISSWNVANVTNMGNLFRGADAFQGELHQWDFRNVTNLFSFMVDKIDANSYNTTNYNLLLRRWADQVATDGMSTTIDVDMGGAQHSGDGTVARGELVTAGWTIADGGAVA